MRSSRRPANACAARRSANTTCAGADRNHRRTLYIKRRARLSVPASPTPTLQALRKESPGSSMQAPETPSTFPALFASVVIARGEHPALVTPDETLSYAELERRTARMARALLASGAEIGRASCRERVCQYV